MPGLPKNVFHDLNQFPQEEGILIFGISMGRIGNVQSPEKCFEYCQYLDKKIKKTAGMGLIFWYADYLYLLSKEPAALLRNRFLNQMFSHRNGFFKIIKKNIEWIPKAFSIVTFGQLLLDNSEQFLPAYHKIEALSKSDMEFRKCLMEDCRDAGMGTDENAQQFILEEITLFYLANKGKLLLRNEFLQGHEKWILQCYPGKPLRSEVYLYQHNPLKLENPKNKYEYSYYDLSDKKLYDFRRIDLKTFDFQDKTHEALRLS